MTTAREVRRVRQRRVRQEARNARAAQVERERARVDQQAHESAGDRS
jgi:hypothetical protein